MYEKQFRLYLLRLDLISAVSWWLSALAAVLILVAFLALLFPGLLVYLLPRGWDSTSPLAILLTVLLLSQAFTLYQGHQFKLFRHRLAAQMDAAEKQRMRADTFYGMSIIDPLTGLHNRRFGEERLKDEVARAERKNQNLAVIAIDLDNFKPINDQFGHAAGDLVLKEFARRLRRAIRPCDVPVRLGGDEFLILLPECSTENVDIIFSRLHPFEVTVNRQKVPVCFSRGRAQYQIGDKPETLVARADERLYADKQARKNPRPSEDGAYGPEELSSGVIHAETRDRCAALSGSLED